MDGSRPRVFVASTVYDFADLRSALRFWLAELGFDVWMSEFNDFPKDATENSYEACLHAVRAADFFILLIGGRVGGWYDRQNKVSITRMEYREALKSFEETGRPIPLAFVRKAIWDVREDRKGLQRVLAEMEAAGLELSADERNRLLYHPSTLVSDARTVSDFLAEVAQTAQMRAAVDKGTQLPQANWIHQFVGFEDIVNGLRVALRATTDVRTMILVANLKTELLTNLSMLFVKCKDGAVVPAYSLGKPARDLFVREDSETSTVPAGSLRGLIEFAYIFCGVGRRLSSTFIREAIRSGAFLQFDARAVAYTTTPLQEALLRLEASIGQLGREEYSVHDISMHLTRYQQESFSGGAVDVRTSDMRLPCSLVSEHEHAVLLSQAVYHSLEGHTEALLALPQEGATRVPSQERSIPGNRVSIQEIEEWIDQQVTGAKRRRESP